MLKPKMDFSGPKPNGPQLKDKLLVIMGATGAGKSRLSLDLAARFPPATFEVINADKMQVYKGLDITTNKLSAPERRVVPHHLLGEFDSRDGDVTPAEFRRLAAQAVSSVVSRRKVPVLVGGSNSFIHALVVDRFEPDCDVFNCESVTVAVSSELRYDCCFLWVDVSLPVLTAYLSQRVEEMLDSGMFHELAEFYGENSAGRTGLRKAIGVAEFSRYFKEYSPPPAAEDEDPVRRGAYDEAVGEIKKNTCRLAKRQMGKIARLRKAGWDLRRLDATEAFRAAVTSDDEEEGKRWSEIWEREVVEPSVKIVTHFLVEEE
ncbi:adenylate isopentenyltransferase-like [Rosa rugosa]|uniref:adenylate isopentenyltransferase-like n=1 Tax=Rosa rugosa TaxID=74645 RepID=UPI002B415957|nr:adenylate isopentenyltransferase-like [Rosa rugosa]